MVRVALTFDDGYMAQLRIARELKSMCIRATFYVVTHKKEHMGHKLLSMKPELISEIASMGHEIGSYTATHADLTTQE